MVGPEAGFGLSNQLYKMSADIAGFLFYSLAVLHLRIAFLDTTGELDAQSCSPAACVTIEIYAMTGITIAQSGASIII